MSEQERTAAEKLAQAFEVLPVTKKEYLLGYADGVSAMANLHAEEAAHDKIADL
jgi:hypothetical protein